MKIGRKLEVSTVFNVLMSLLAEGVIDEFLVSNIMMKFVDNRVELLKRRKQNMEISLFDEAAQVEEIQKKRAGEIDVGVPF